MPAEGFEGVEFFEEARPPTPESLEGCPQGEVRGIVFYPDERLAQVSEDVPQDFWGDQLNKLVADLVTTMYMCGGVGLSAIQVGVPLRVFVCDIFAQGAPPRGPQKNQLLTVVNPVVKVVDPKDVRTHREGCLSFPSVSEVVERPDKIVLQARDRFGNAYALPPDGILSRVIQHEVDHLDGLTFLDRMKPLAKKSAMKSIKRFHSGVSDGTIRVRPKPKNPPKQATRKANRKKRKRR